MGHKCHARGCAKEVAPRLLMCFRHWKLVPYALQKAVWDEYVPGQEIRKDPTLEYITAAHAAIDHVAALHA